MRTLDRYTLANICAAAAERFADAAHTMRSTAQTLPADKRGAFLSLGAQFDAQEAEARLYASALHNDDVLPTITEKF